MIVSRCRLLFVSTRRASKKVRTISPSWWSRVQKFGWIAESPALMDDHRAEGAHVGGTFQHAQPAQLPGPPVFVPPMQQVQQQVGYFCGVPGMGRFGPGPMNAIGEPCFVGPFQGSVTFSSQCWLRFRGAQAPPRFGFSGSIRVRYVQAYAKDG
jgi:hypothetical protein